MILSVTPNPCIDKTLFTNGLALHSSNRVIRTETDAGGKGVNLARIATELGEKSLATGLLGGRTGATVKSVLDEENVPYHFIDTFGETRTNVSIEDGSGRPPTTFNERGIAVDVNSLSELFELVSSKLKHAYFVCMGGSTPPGVPPDFYARIVNVCVDQNVRAVVDAEGDLLQQALLKKPFLVKPNLSEAATLLNRKIESLADGLEAAFDIHRMGAQIAIVSMGAQGAALATEDEQLISEPIKIKPESTIGAGDSMIAGFLVGLVRGKSLDESFRLGSAAGAATTLSSGANIGRRKDIEELFTKAKIRRVK